MIKDLDSVYGKNNLTKILSDKDSSKEILTLHSIYAHGKLDDLLGYDIVGIDKSNPHLLYELLWCNESKMKRSVMSDFGECILYFWRLENSIGKGLICLKDDLESIEDAEEKCKVLRKII